jgi:hypothetical protein
MWNMEGAEALGFKIFNLKYRRSIMTGRNTSENMKVEMPSTNASGDPETATIPTVKDDKSTVTGKTKPAPKTNPEKSKTGK